MLNNKEMYSIVQKIVDIMNSTYDCGVKNKRHPFKVIEDDSLEEYENSLVRIKIRAFTPDDINEDYALSNKLYLNVGLVNNYKSDRLNFLCALYNTLTNKDYFAIFDVDEIDEDTVYIYKRYFTEILPPVLDNALCWLKRQLNNEKT